MAISPRRRDDASEARESGAEVIQPPQLKPHRTADAAPLFSPEKIRQVEKRSSPSSNAPRHDEDESERASVGKQQQGGQNAEQSLTLRPSIDVDVTAQKADFEMFTSTTAEGKSLAQDLDECKRRLKAKKKVVKEVADEVNYQKDRIDFLITQMSSGASTSPRAGSSPSSGKGDGSANDPTVQLKLAKSSYRSKLDEFNQGKEELKFLAHQKDVCFQTLIARFDKWITSGGNRQSPPKNVTPPQHIASKNREHTQRRSAADELGHASSPSQQRESPSSDKVSKGRGQHAETEEQDAPAYTSQQYESALVRASSRGRLNRSGEVKWKS